MDRLMDVLFCLFLLVVIFGYIVLVDLFIMLYILFLLFCDFGVF